MPQPKKTVTPCSPLSASSGLSFTGAGQVLTLNTPPAPRPIEDALIDAEIEWMGDFANIKIPPLDDSYELAEVATWIEEICQVELVQFEFYSSVALVRKKRK